jgi:hypothetical protein
MPDSSSSSTSSSSSEAAPKPKGYFNKAQLEDIGLARDINAAASAPVRAAAFAGKDITPEFRAKQDADIELARRKTTETGQDQDEGGTATLQASGARRALVTMLQGIQSAAKQRQRMEAVDDDPATNFSTDGYLLNVRMNANRSILLQSAATLKSNAERDELPGFKTPADIQRIADAIQAYEEAGDEQNEGDAEAGEDRLSRDALLRRINARRIATQHAADSLWPYTEEASGPMRTLFHLPKSRPMTE